MAKHVSAYRGAGLNPNRVTKKPKQDWVSAYKRDEEKNRGGLIGGLGYVGGNLGLGLAGIGEGVGDIVSAGADLLRGDTDMAKYRFLDNQTAEAQQSLRDWYNPGSVMEFAGDVASGIGQSSVFLLDAVAPGVGTGLFFAGVGGQGISSAAARTGDVGWREVGYGVASGAAEGALELAMGAGSKVAGKLGASITRKTGTAIGQKSITTALTKSAGKRAWSSIAKATAKDAAGEFAEEFASEYIDSALLQAFGIDPNASTSFGEAVRAGMVGLFSGGIMGAPANVINYKNAAKAGRTIRESGETENLLNRAQATVSVLREQEAVKKAEGKKVKKTDEGTEAAEQKGFLARQGAKREARRAAEYAAKLEKNVNAYRNMKAEMRNSEVGDALLGELRGNLYFTNMAYAVEEAEIVLRNVDDAQAQKIVDYINTEAKAAKQEKSDYTVEDFRLNRDGILSQFAAKGRMEQLVNGEWTEAEEMAAQAAEATESPVEAAGAAGAVMGEEVNTPEQAAPAEESEAVQAAEAPVDHKARAEQILREMGETVSLDKLATAIAKKQTGEALDANERLLLKDNRKAELVLERMQRESRQKKAPEKAEAKPEAKKQTKGTVTVSDGMKPNKDFSDVQYATYKAAGILADSLGLNIEIHKSLERNDKIVNGYYDTGTKVLHVNINAMRDGRQIALYTLGHELTHYIKDWSPEKFNALADFVAEQMGTDMETAVDEKMASLRRLGLLDKKTTEQAAEMAREEVVADGMELILTDGRVLDELAKTDKSLWEKVRDWIKSTVAKIRKYYGELNQASKTAQVLKETMDSLDELERLFTEGVREAGERAATAEVETRTEGEKVYSFTPADFEKPITLHDIEVLRSIGRKSINAFTSADIEKALKWAYKFYNEQKLRTKSPFFRAWFGDWRAYDETPKEVISVKKLGIMERKDADIYVRSGIKNKTFYRGNVKNEDTDFDINIGTQVYDDTLTYANRKYSRNGDFEQYISRISILQNIKEVVEKSVLLDTSVINDADNPNRTFMHYFYSVCTIDSKQYLVKMGVDELNANSGTVRRAYNVNNIEISPIAVSQVYRPAGTIDDSGETISTVSIAQIFETVKTYDKDFSPKPVNELMLNDDGTPKVFYHGTNQGDFNEFLWEKTQRADGGFYGRGHYFTSSEGMAKLYGSRMISAYLALKKPFVWRDEVNTWNGRRGTNIVSQNIVARINLARIFPELFANAQIDNWQYDERAGDYVNKPIKWSELEKMANDITKEMHIASFADGTYKWFALGKFFDEGFGDRYNTVEEAEKDKFFVAAEVLASRYDGIARSMSFDDQTTYTQQYGDEITALLKKKGYDGAMQDRKGTEVVVFNSTSIKSATDNIGTFDADNPDIRYSIDEDSDTAYLAAVERGDMETAQKMVDKAAKEAGYINLFYHGAKKGGGFTVFRDWSYFTENKAYAERYTDREKPSSLYKTYVKMDKPFDTRKTKDRRLFAQIRDEYGLGEIQDTGLPDWTDGYDISDYIDENDLDYDGIILDEGGDLVDGVPISRGLSYVVRKSAQIKSADPVTYDDSGNVIPLSERFKEDNPDIRYSIDDTPETPDVSGNAGDTVEGGSRAMTWDEAFGTAVTGSSFRQALAEALEKTIETDSEYKILKDYSESIARLNNLQKQIDELNATASALREKQFYSPSKEERSSAAKELQSIYERRRKLEDEMAKGDSRLERLRQTEPIRNIVRSAERAEKERSKTEEQYKSDRREMSVRERVARRVIGRLNTMFYSPSRTKHVPADLQALVEAVLKSEKLDTFKDTRKNLRQMAELERDIEKLEQNPARTAAEQERLDKLHYKYAMLEDEGLDAKGQAEALYTAFKTWMESRPEGQQDKALMDKLSSEIDKMQEMPLSMMSKKSLEAVEDFYKMIYHQVNTANQIYTTERVLYVDDLGGKASQEAQDTKSLKFLSPKAMEIKGKDSIRRFFWKNMKPLTVFEAIGSKTFTGLFQAVLDGEGVWAKDILEARAKIVEAREAHKYKDWDLEKRVEVKTKEGTVKLSLSERMSLYAYAKRAQAVSHLEGGGFVLDPKATTKEGKTIAGIALEKRLNDSTRYVLDETLMGDIASTLTAEQKAYVDEMQTYLTQLGKKGNEVSRKLYGMEIFKEDFYFPIKVMSEYRASKPGKTGDPNIKNRGMTKEVVPEAKDPLVLQGFDEVMADHINSMATYHAFVLPVEDLTRVLNYKPANYLKDENGEVILDDAGKPKADPEAAKDYSTLKAVIKKKYGEDAVKYIEQVIRDLNGGARRDAAAGILDRGLTAFKRASTMASLSVLVQQPTSLIRAAAYIDPKYLFGNTTIIDFKNHKELWERVKKYAPVAVIKEMGGYDTGVGTRTADYLNATEYEKGERLKGFVKDENYRAEVFGRGAAYADEMAWIQMFEACVSEQADKMGKSRDSEEVLQAAGKRFEEVIRHTQVYDSTLTRSENMRSKDTGMKMATAFMAEPTTIVSMVAEAIMKAERGDKTFLRNTAAAVAGSIVINAIAASLVYAMRDDDEDETYGEKYVSTLAMEVADGFNPLGYLPVARDVVSLMQGYEVERTDMALIGNLIEQVNMITSSKRSVGDKIFGVSGAVSAFFGVPVTNLYRDAKGAINTVLNSTSPEATTGAGVSAAVKKEFTTIFGLFDKQTTDGYQLYKAYVDGDTAHYNRVKARYEDEKAAEQALRKELRENDRRIGEAAKARMNGETELYESIVRAIVSEGIFDRNMVIRAVNNEISALERELEKGTLVPEDPNAEETPESLYKASDLNAALERGDRADFELIYDTILGERMEQGKTEAQAKAAVKSSITAYWKKQYLSGYQDTETRKRIIKLLTDTGLYGSRNDVATMCEGWVKAKK